jgi:hypothetical protein
MGAAVFFSLRFCNGRTLDQFLGFPFLRFAFFSFVVLTGGRFFAGARRESWQVLKNPGRGFCGISSSDTFLEEQLMPLPSRATPVSKSRL